MKFRYSSKNISWKYFMFQKLLVKLYFIKYSVSLPLQFQKTIYETTLPSDFSKASLLDEKSIFRTLLNTHEAFLQKIFFKISIKRCHETFVNGCLLVYKTFVNGCFLVYSLNWKHLPWMAAFLVYVLLISR